MKRLPNNLTVYNATPHPIRFWHETWPEPITVESDTVINATPIERSVPLDSPRDSKVEFVRTEFVGTDEGRQIIDDARRNGADVIVGSIIAAQAYPGMVVAMTPSPGYERVPPADKRMNPYKFTIFEDKP